MLHRHKDSRIHQEQYKAVKTGQCSSRTLSTAKSTLAYKLTFPLAILALAAVGEIRPLAMGEGIGKSSPPKEDGRSMIWALAARFSIWRRFRFCVWAGNMSYSKRLNMENEWWL